MPNPVNNDISALVKKMADDYTALLQAQNKEDYENKKAEIARTAQAKRQDDLEKNSKSSEKNRRTGEEMTYWQHMELEADENLQQDLSSFNTGAQAAAKMVAMYYLMCKALNHSLRGLIFIPIKHALMMKSDIAELKQVGDLPPMQHLVGFKDGKIDIKPLGISNDSENPQAKSLVQGMNTTFAQMVKFWLTEEHGCIATADPNVFLDSNSNPLTEDSFNAMKNHATKGFQAYLDAKAPGLLFKERAPMEEPEPERSGPSP